MTHRAVAAEADVPLSSTTYYFEPLESARRFRAEFEDSSVAQFELYLEASRRPRLREVARRCLDVYASTAASALRAAGAEQPEAYLRAFVALFDGYGLHRIAGGGDQGFEDALMALWAAATRATGTR